MGEVKSTAFQLLHDLLNMAIFDILEVLFHGFQLVKVHLDLFYLVLIAVELSKSAFLAIGRLKAVGRLFVVFIRNLNAINGSLTDVYHFFIFKIFVNARLRRD